VIAGAIGSIIWANWLNFEIRQQDKDYKSLDAEYKNWKFEFDSISKEIEKIKKLDSQIREYWGLEKGGLTVGGQGGSGDGTDGDTLDTSEDVPPTSSHTLPETGENKKLLLAQKAGELRELRSNLQQINDIAESKRDELARTPTISPVPKECSWYTSEFGNRKDPFTKKWKFHYGLDIAAMKGTRVFATAKGVIKSKTKDRYLGYTITIRHRSKFSTKYGHLSRFAKGLKVNDEVSRGDVIGYVGESGRATGPHLHYEVHEYGKPVNPIRFILD